MSTCVVIPAAGSGSRLGHERPKAFVELDGRTLLEHSVFGALASGIADHIVVAVPEALLSDARGLLRAVAAEARADHGMLQAVTGGADRISSVRAALRAAPHCEIVMVHDAARCLTPPAVYARVHAAVAAGAAGAVPVLPVVDTIKRVTADAAGAESLIGDLDRAQLRRVQTPQGFPRDVLDRAHALQEAEPDPTATDDAMLVERLGLSIVPVPGDEQSLKITYPLDLQIAHWHLRSPDAQH